MEDAGYLSRQGAWENLLAIIAEQGLRPGDRLPPERELSERWSLSRGTLRSAVAALVREGRLYTLHGVGTFVAAPRFERSLQGLESLSESVARSGRRLSTSLLFAREVPCDAAFCTAFALPKGAEMTEIIRLRRIDDCPSFIETAYVPLTLAPELACRMGDDMSLYGVLESEYAIALRDGEQRIGITYASDEESRLLGVRLGAPLFWVESKARDAEGRLIEFCHAVIRPDKVSMSSVLRGGEHG
ncbi:MAG: GntR family transcriptional regulator [Clostridiaceae bacterium]